MALNMFQRKRVNNIIINLNNDIVNNISQPIIKMNKTIKNLNQTPEITALDKNLSSLHNEGWNLVKKLSIISKHNKDKSITTQEVTSLQAIKANIEKLKSATASHQNQLSNLSKHSEKNNQNYQEQTQSDKEARDQEQTKSNKEAQAQEQTQSDKETRAQESTKSNKEAQKEPEAAKEENTQENQGLTQDQINFEKEVIKKNRDFSNSAKEFISSVDKNDPNMQNKINDFVNENAEFFGDSDDIIKMASEGDLNLNLIEEKMNEAEQTANQAENNIRPIQKEEPTTAKEEPTVAKEEKPQENQGLSQEDINFEKAVAKYNAERLEKSSEILKLLNDPEKNKEKILGIIEEMNTKYENQGFGDGFEELNEATNVNDINYEIVKNVIQESTENMNSAKRNLGQSIVYTTEDYELDSVADLALTAVVDTKIFKNSKGIETKFENFNETNNLASIKFDKPVVEHTADAYSFTPDGSKMMVGNIKKQTIEGVQVSVNPNGLINFNNPKNKDLLSHPNVLAEIIKMYPESFKTLPPAVYATDPKLFAESFKDGTIKKAESASMKDNDLFSYYNNADYELTTMNENAKGKSTNIQNKAIEAIEKDVNFDQEIQRGL